MSREKFCSSDGDESSVSVDSELTVIERSSCSTRWRCNAVVCLSVCCLTVSALSLSVAIVCVTRHQHTAALVDRLDTELHQLKEAYLYHLRSVAESGQEEDYETDGYVDFVEEDYHQHPEIGAIVLKPDADGRSRRDASDVIGRHRRQTTNGNNAENNNKKKNEKKKKNNKEARSRNKTEASLEPIIHMQPENMEELEKAVDSRALIGWKVSEWSRHSNLHPLSHKKTLKIDQAGYYLIYAQIGYYTNADENGFSVVVKATRNGDVTARVLTRCMLGVDYVDPTKPPADTKRYKTCHTSTVAHLAAAEQIELHDDSIVDSVEFYHDLHTHYWGVVRLAAGQ